MDLEPYPTFFTHPIGYPANTSSNSSTTTTTHTCVKQLWQQTTFVNSHVCPLVSDVSHVWPTICQKEKEFILGSINFFIKNPLENTSCKKEICKFHLSLKIYHRELWGGLCILHPMPPHYTDSKGWHFLSIRRVQKKRKEHDTFKQNTHSIHEL